MSYLEINKHMKNKFSSYDKVIELETLPNKEKLESMNDNTIYKVPYICLFIDMVDFKKIDKYTNPKIMNAVMSEYVYGVTKIMKEYNGKSINIQGDGIFCILKAKTKDEVNFAYSLACELNTFVTHMQYNIVKMFDNKFKVNYFTASFNCGIGLWLSWENYISKVGHNYSRELIYMGESVKYASVLSKKASRQSIPSILLNNLIYSNLNSLNKELCSRNYSFALNNLIYQSSAIIRGYNNFISNNL